MASTTRKPRQSTADANAAAVTAEKLTQPDNGLTTSDEQSAAEATAMKSPAELQAELVATVEAVPSDPAWPVATPNQEAKRRRATAVAARAAEVKTEQAATPKPTKPIDEAKLAETNAVTSKVLELLANVDASSAENSATKIAAAVGTTYATVRRIARENNHLFAAQQRRSAS